MHTQFVNGEGSRPADHRIALAHLRGMTARQIGEALMLPTEYIEKRLPLVVDMPIVVPPAKPTLANRLLVILQDAKGQPVRVEDLLGVYPENQEGSIGSVKFQFSELRKRSHLITARCMHEMLKEPRLGKTSTVMAGMVGRLRTGMATSEELGTAGCVRTVHVRRYVHMLRERGAKIVLHRTYALTVAEESES